MKARRLMLGLSQPMMLERLRERGCEVDQAMYSRYENEKCYPPIEVLSAIAKVLEMPYCYLYAKYKGE